jgi:malonyl-[acp] decarboxylase
VKNENLPVITGFGITSAIGQGQRHFAQALFDGASQYKRMEREGRQKESDFIGAEIDHLQLPSPFSEETFRNTSLTAKVAALTLYEAWQDAALDDIDPKRIGLIIGGSNTQQRQLYLLSNPYRDTPYYLRPQYGMSYLDSDITGFCSEPFNIRGHSYTVGGASASGQLALIHAAQRVKQKELDICIALGALMDVSFYELFAFQAMGAMAVSDELTPEQINRPFDKAHQGFVYGENCAAIVVETKAHAKARGASAKAAITGWSVQMDGHRNPDPSLDGELGVIHNALAGAKLQASDIDYINPHGTGAPLGDETEINALRSCGLTNAYINTTKSITGHGLSSAGCVEIAATLLQIQEKRLHPSLNLSNPIDENLNWVKSSPVEHKINNALNLSFGFGGVNTAVCLQQSDLD